MISLFCVFCLVSLVSLVIREHACQGVFECLGWFADVTGKKVVYLLKLIAGLTNRCPIIPPAHGGVAGDFPVTVCANAVACHIGRLVCGRLVFVRVLNPLVFFKVGNSMLMPLHSTDNFCI